MKDYVIVILPSYNTMYYYYQPVTNAATATARTRRGLGIRGVVPPPVAARQVCARALGDRSASPRRLRFPGANEDAGGVRDGRRRVSSAANVHVRGVRADARARRAPLVDFFVDVFLRPPLLQRG